MVRTWGAGEELGRQSGFDGLVIRQVTADDMGVIGGLLWRAFGREGPDGYATEDHARAEASDTLVGKWGPMIWEASVLGLVAGVPVAAAIVVRDDAHGLRPLLAFVVTDPDHQDRGLGRQLLGEALGRLDRLGVRELHLAVDRSNPAQRLYRRLGFEDAVD